ncbi:MAG: hypothetical protein JJ863_30625 [Deltaproteobacteria bacterium]|nr:hypothetical protein [Deltaproteobacteria bacterium]
MELRSVTLSRWARGTLLGPMVTIWILITLAAGTESLDALADWVGLAGRFTDEWWLAMLLGSFWASTLAVALVAVDVALLRSKFRALPTGIRCWFGGLLSPFVVAVWQIALPKPSSIPMLVGLTAATFVLSALSVRVLFGRRP